MSVDTLFFNLLFVLFCLTPVLLLLVVFYLRGCMKSLKVIADDIRERRKEAGLEETVGNEISVLTKIREKIRIEGRRKMPVMAEEKEPVGVSVNQPAEEVLPESKSDAGRKSASIFRTPAPADTASVSGKRRTFVKSEILKTVEKRLFMLKNWFLYGVAFDQVIIMENREQMMASTWLMRGGILISLFTAAFLLKLSMDYGILAPVWRVILTVIVASGLLLWGLKICRGRYGRLGQTFVGIGLALFYFAGMAAGTMYGLLPSAVCGAFMILVTVSAGMIADRLSSLGIALIAIIGGYCTPMMLRSSQVQYLPLGAYLFLLGCGVIWLSLRKNWQPLQWLGLLAAYFLFYGAFSRAFTPQDYAVVQITLVLLFLQYTLAFVIYQLKHRQSFTILETWAFLIHSFIFLGMNWLLLERMGFSRQVEALLPLLLSFFYTAAVYVMLYRRFPDRLMMTSCIGLASLYLSLTFPVALSGKWLGASWALQALLMVWLGFSLNSGFTRRMGWGLFGICLMRLCFWDLSAAGWSVCGSQEYFWRHFVERFLGYLIPIGSLAAASWLEKHPPLCWQAAGEDRESGRQESKCDAWHLRILFLGVLLLFIYLNIEIRNVCGHLYGALEMPVRIWLWGIGLTGLLRWSNLLGVSENRFRRALLWILMLGMLIPMFLQNLNWGPSPRFFSWGAASCQILSIASASFFMWYAVGILNGCEEKLARFAAFIWPVLLFGHLTHDVDMITSCRLTGLQGGGVSILWSIFAFVLVYRGLCLRNRRFRYIGLGLFLIVMVKVLFSDLSSLSAVYRVVAFFLFGLLLIGGSWLYMKLWKNTNCEGKDAEG